MPHLLCWRFVVHGGIRKGSNCHGEPLSMDQIKITMEHPGKSVIKKKCRIRRGYSRRFPALERLADTATQTEADVNGTSRAHHQLPAIYFFTRFTKRSFLLFIPSGKQCHRGYPHAGTCSQSVSGVFRFPSPYSYTYDFTLCMCCGMCLYRRACSADLQSKIDPAQALTGKLRPAMDAVEWVYLNLSWFSSLVALTTLGFPLRSLQLLPRTTLKQGISRHTTLIITYFAVDMPITFKSG